MTQAMTETDVAEDQTTQEEGASDDLDSLLNEFSEATKPTEQPKVELNDVQEVVSYVQEERAAKAEQTTKADIDAAVDSIADNLDIEVPSKRIIRGLLQDIASNDKAIQQAFAQRNENPQAWKAALKRATNEMKEELSVDQEATSDREALTSAVRSASTKQPEPQEEVDLNSMSDQEFIMYKARLR